jgi:hypothetical protein
MWKEAIVAYKAMFRYLNGGTEETHEIPQSTGPVSRPRSEPGTSLIRSRSINYSTATFGLLKFSAQKIMVDTSFFRHDCNVFA